MCGVIFTTPHINNFVTSSEGESVAVQGNLCTPQLRTGQVLMGAPSSTLHRICDLVSRTPSLCAHIHHAYTY